MCKAFSCLIDKNKHVTWQFNIDRHDELIKLAKYENRES